MVSSQPEGEEDCQDCCAVLFKSLVIVVVIVVVVVVVMVFPVRTTTLRMTAVRAADGGLLVSPCRRSEG